MESELTGIVLMMIDMSAKAVGGKVNFLDITFKDGKKIRCRRISPKVIDIPNRYTDDDIKDVSVPFDQNSPAAPID